MSGFSHEFVLFADLPSSIVSTFTPYRRKAADRPGRQKKRETLLELQERLKKVKECSCCSAEHQVVVQHLPSSYERHMVILSHRDRLVPYTLHCVGIAAQDIQGRPPNVSVSSDDLMLQAQQRNAALSSSLTVEEAQRETLQARPY